MRARPKIPIKAKEVNHGTVLRTHFARWLKYTEIAEGGEIARRCFAMNPFDGVLAIMGVRVGNDGARVMETKVVSGTFCFQTP